MTEVIMPRVTSPAAYSAEIQRRVLRDISLSDEAHAKEGDTFCLITQRWWQTWSAFVNQDLPISTNNGPSSEHQGSSVSNTLQRPPSIDNSDLICRSASENSPEFEIYDTLVEGTDYILVSEKMWNQFYEWYGGGPALARKVITRGSSETELTVEVYPLRLQLHLMTRDEQYAIRLSRKETLGQLHMMACEVFDLNSDQVRIWDYYGRRKHALLTEMDKTLDDVNIQMDQDILVEVIDQSGSNTTAVQVNGDSENHPLAFARPSRTNQSNARGSSANNGISRSSHPGLSQFQNLSFAKDKGSTSVGVSTRGSCVGLIGLLNFGNTCFMNSAIQCLVHTPEFASFFIGDFHKEINWQNPLGMEGELAMAFGELLRRLWAPGRSAFAPRAFKTKLARFAPQFGGQNQHDSQELLAFLLDGLHEDLNRVKQKPYVNTRDVDGRPDEQVADECWANHISRNDSIIVDVCQGQYKSTLVCPVCDKISVTFDPFMYLSLPLQSATPRTMTVTVFCCDGSVTPVTCTVTVPKLGRCRDLIQALSNACSLKQNEQILLAEIQDHMIHRFLDDPLMSLSSIKHDERLSAYKIPLLMRNSMYLQFVHRREDVETSTWKLYGTPLVYPVSRDATITRGDIQLIAHTILSPMLKADNSDANTSSVASNPLSTNNDSEPYSPFKQNDYSLIKFPLKLVDGNNNPIDISAEEEKTIKLSSSSMLVLLYIDWSPELVKIYEMHYLEYLPEVSKSRHGKKKARVEPVSLYSCIEAFLREEPLVPEDMWFCPQCEERRQASKKLDLWRLPTVLVIHLKRFSYSKTVKTKLERFVNFPLGDFDLTKYVANKQDLHPQVYELYAVANHYGNMGSGHYTAHVKLFSENKWYNFDDNHVSPIGEDDVKSNAAYVLFYRRMKTDDVSLSSGAQSSAD
ncbi:peptidase C19, ubiquitin-specific peptidase, DUSP domain-containing protein [Artemisia annua]|uniref:Ubiquitin carboxyl-terminal hydrolase n=1 Tax=Artemisia annua TaxID=35608 RepID=A0A2U1LNL7_ARTAN|nr:peptidase C19, ubiquitin-specific peptidase, DUSP domain-containing protein [Artemisia annua]